MTRETKRLTLNVTSFTLVGGDDNPNCFSLQTVPGSWNSVRVVNMKLGQFDRVVSHGYLTDDVEAEVIDGHYAVLTDPRIPRHELSERWCPACLPFRYLPSAQQRAYLRTTAPIVRDGNLIGWSWMPGVTHDDAAVDASLAALQAIGEATP